MREEIIEKIYKLVSDEVEWAEMFDNLENDPIIIYKQGGKKYLITIEQL